MKLKIDNAKQLGKLNFFPLLFDVQSLDLFDVFRTLIEYKIKS